MRRRQHCLMFSSAGSQAQTYFVNFDTLVDYQRWHRQASKVSKDAFYSVYRLQYMCLPCVPSVEVHLVPLDFTEIKCEVLELHFPSRCESTNQQLPPSVCLIGSTETDSQQRLALIEEHNSVHTTIFATSIWRNFY